MWQFSTKCTTLLGIFWPKRPKKTVHSIYELSWAELNGWWPTQNMGYGPRRQYWLLNKWPGQAPWKRADPHFSDIAVQHGFSTRQTKRKWKLWEDRLSAHVHTAQRRMVLWSWLWWPLREIKDCSSTWSYYKKTSMLETKKDRIVCHFSFTYQNHSFMSSLWLVQSFLHSSVSVKVKWMLVGHRHLSFIIQRTILAIHNPYSS